jgi:hypothetical protein
VAHNHSNTITELGGNFSKPFQDSRKDRVGRLDTGSIVDRPPAGFDLVTRDPRPNSIVTIIKPLVSPYRHSDSLRKRASSGDGALQRTGDDEPNILSLESVSECLCLRLALLSKRRVESTPKETRGIQRRFTMSR